MASRRGDTFDKRQRERRRQEKAAVKRARRQGQEVGPRPNTNRTAPRTSAESDALEKFRILSQHHAAGGIDDETFQFMRAEIFGELDIEPPDNSVAEKAS